MKRRRLLWLGVAAVLIGGAIAAWLVLAQRDADFVTAGPRTKGVRDNFAKLDRMIDPAEFRDCKTVNEAFGRLNRQVAMQDSPDERHWSEFWLRHRGWLRVDSEAFTLAGKDLLESPFSLPADSQPISVKQFMRMTFTQTGVPEVGFIVRGHHILVTTMAQAQDERTNYLDSVSVYDRLRNLWKEMMGDLADDPREELRITIK